MIRGIVGTAGHIDHGKTALVQALTGVDTDRLPEEKRRGITIDLGFTHLPLADGVAGLIDVPGHEDFIRNMVAGASGFDLLLLVVAADEGVMPQTREHVAIAELLGVPRAVVALTKTDLVDDDWRELAIDDVVTFLAGTRFTAAPVLPTSARTGAGLDALRAALDDALPPARGRPDDLFRLPVDRAFTVHGTGTVVTGTVWSGRLGRDQHVRALPGDETARVRGLQVHGADVDEIHPGQRAAVALVGLDRDQVGRGTTLVTDPAWTPTRTLAVSLRVLPASEWEIEHGQRLRVHVATSEVMGRAFPIDQQALAPGDERWAEIRLEAPVVARTGDRLVVRSFSPVTTIGGGLVVEPLPRRRRLRADDVRTYHELVGADPTARVGGRVRQASVAGVTYAALPILAGVTPQQLDTALQEIDAVHAAGLVFPAEAGAAVAAALIDAVTLFHREHPLRAGMDPQALRRAAPAATADALTDHVLEGLTRRHVLAMRDGRVALVDHVPDPTPEQQGVMDRIERALADAGYAPPRLDELRHALGQPHDLLDLLALLETRGLALRLEHDLFIHSHTVDRITRDVRSRFAGREDVGPAEFRDVIPTSRRHLMPILAYLDRAGVTARVGEGRAVKGSMT